MTLSRRPLCSLIVLLLTLWSAAGLAAPGGPSPVLEERGQIFHPALGRSGMVSAAEPLAVAEGVRVLREGGNAVDAAVTMAFVEAVTLPQAGNLGGGGFLLIRTAAGEVVALDFREEAPAAAHRDMYLDAEGKVDRRLATRGHRAAGVPGTVAGLAEALRRHGTIPLRRAVEPARRLAAEGFAVPPSLAADLESARGSMEAFPATMEIFFPEGRSPSHLVQRDLAWSLGRIQAEGTDAFYRGEIARRLAADMAAHGGLITTSDLAAYRPVWRKPVHGTYRGHDVWSMPPPSSGGVHLVQMLNVLEGYDLRSMGQNSAAVLHRMAEAMRTAYADRSKWLGDPDEVTVPLDFLTSRDYADRIRAAIPEDRARDSRQVAPVAVPGFESPETTHLTVVDGHGQAASLTYTLNFHFGGGAVARGTGILLNNEMDDFSAAPGVPNAFGLLGGERNAIAPGRRPLSSMTPTLVTRDGKLVMALGSPGGSRIITTVLQVMVNCLDFDLNAQEAVSRPRIHHQWLPDELRHESGLSPDTLRILEGYGHRLVPGTATGHAALVRVRPDGTLEGGIDPRRPGAAEGY